MQPSRRQPDAFDYEILQAAAEKGLRKTRRGWCASFGGRHFPEDRLRTLTGFGHAYFENDEIGRIFVVSKAGRAALAEWQEGERARDDAFRDMGTGPFELSYLTARLL